MGRRSYTDAEKAEAIELYRTDGPTAAGEALGIDKGLITRWAQKAGVATVANERNAAATEAARLKWEDRRLDLAHRMGEVAELALDLAEEKLHDGTPSSAREAATTMAILVDKAQILTGGATGHQRHTIDRSAHIESARDRALRLVPGAA